MDYILAVNNIWSKYMGEIKVCAHWTTGSIGLCSLHRREMNEMRARLALAFWVKAHSRQLSRVGYIRLSSAVLLN